MSEETQPNMKNIFFSICRGIILSVVLNTSVVLGTEDPLIPLHRYYNRRIGDHFYTTNWGELGGGRGGYAYEGVACKLPKAGVVEGTVPLHRYYNPRSGDHFYTTNWDELGGGRSGYVYEGVQGYVFRTQEFRTVPLHRYFNGRSGDHFYTTNWAELGGGAGGYAHEGNAGYVYAASDKCEILT